MKGLAFGGPSPDWVPGKIGTWALDFEAAATDYDYVDCGPDPITLDVNTMTVMAWIKAESWGGTSTSDVFVSTRTFSGGGQGFELMGGQSTSGDPRGALNFTVAEDGPQDWRTARSQTYMYTGIWYHVTGLYDGNNLKVYIDGQLKGSNTTAVRMVSAEELHIAHSIVSGQLFDGVIDDVRVYNYALTQAQIVGAMESSIVIIPLSAAAAKANLYEDPYPALQVINFKDFAVLANDWLVDNLSP